MKKIRIVLSGATGYGGYYLKLLSECVDEARFELGGIVDPFVSSVDLEWVKARKIPFYSSLEDYYAVDHADLAIISCPIRFHKEQCILAMQKGSHVLCEKPLTVEMKDAKDLEQAAKEYGKFLGVGFQWSFCTPILSMKKDILAGKFGKPVMLKTFISWKRYDPYYLTSSWKGRIHDKDGYLVQDSVATNATAHYLHNLFFVMGDKISSAALPEKVTYATYRAKDIESFDTCFAKGNFANGGEFLYIATHSGDVEIEPRFCYEFENAVITMEKPAGNPHIIAEFKDGSVVDYGAPQAHTSNAEKIVALLDAIEFGKEISCPVPAVLPHLAVCTGFFREAPIYNLPADRIYREENPAGTFVHGFTQDCLTCYEKGLLPSEAGMDWAVPEKTFDPQRYM
ncbi:MAG: Gfo/Idh/MocA family protein [Candidatus Merdivicinus sp.]|jgi:predicted dehydrogenase